jgi:hypothetical protein
MSKSIDRMVMERAIKLVEAGWTQGSWAQDRNGNRVDWDTEEAVSFCAVGAIMRATRELLGSDILPYIWSFRRPSCLTGDEAADMMARNDVGTKEMTLEMMREKLTTL